MEDIRAVADEINGMASNLERDEAAGLHALQLALFLDLIGEEHDHPTATSSSTGTTAEGVATEEEELGEYWGSRGTTMKRHTKMWFSDLLSAARRIVVRNAA